MGLSPVGVLSVDESRPRPHGHRQGAFSAYRAGDQETLLPVLLPGLMSCCYRFATGLVGSRRRQASLVPGVARLFVRLHGQRVSGEGGIRTLERAYAPYSLSRRVPSATRPPLRGGFRLTPAWPWTTPTPATRRRSPRSPRHSRSSTSTRCGPTRRTCSG